MYKNDICQVLDEADMISESINNIMTKSENKHEASALHQVNNGASFIYDKPLRPLSAYNIYFQLQRERFLKYGMNHKGYETIPFTIQDMNRVVQERYRNWAGIAPSSTTDIVVSKNKNKNDIRVPSFGELSSQIGSSWKKLDNETKQLFESFANEKRMEHIKIYGTTNKRKNSVCRELIPSTLSPTQQKNPCSTLNEVSPIVERSVISPVVSPKTEVSTNKKYQMMDMHNMNQIDASDKNDDTSLYGKSNRFGLGKKHYMNSHCDVASQNRGHNSMQLLQKQPNLNMMTTTTLNHQNRQINMIQKRNMYMVQYRFRMWQQYQIVRRKQYDSMMTSLMTDSQSSQHFMTQDNDDNDDYNPLVATFHEQDNNTNHNFQHHHVVSSSSHFLNNSDDVTCFDNETLRNDSVKIYHSNNTVLPNVSNHSSFSNEHDNDDESFDERAWIF